MHLFIHAVHLFIIRSHSIMDRALMHCDCVYRFPYISIHAVTHSLFLIITCSHSIMDRALMHCDCVYRFPALRAQGNVCRTNLPSHTAFRGFGGPQVGGWLAEACCDVH